MNAALTMCDLLVVQGTWGWDQTSVGEESAPGGGVGEGPVCLQRPGGEKPDSNVWWHETTDEQSRGWPEQIQAGQGETDERI